MAEMKKSEEKVTVKAAESKDSTKESVKEPEVKKEVAKKAPVMKTAVKKEAVKKEPVKKAAPKKDAEKSVSAEAAKAETPKAEKKPAARRTVKKAAEVKGNVTVQFAGKSYSEEDLIKIAKDVWKYDLGKDEADFKTVELYVKTEESSVYYVINQEVTGSFAI